MRANMDAVGRMQVPESGARLDTCVCVCVWLRVGACVQDTHNEPLCQRVCEWSSY